MFLSICKKSPQSVWLAVWVGGQRSGQQVATWKQHDLCRDAAAPAF